MGLKTLERALGRFFRPEREKKRDPSYHQFRVEVKRLGLTYHINKSDGYVDFSNGHAVPHYGDWQETLDRLKEEAPKWN